MLVLVRRQTMADLQPKVWIVPVEITCMVGDATKYDAEMKQFIDQVLNELRSICGNFDGGRKLLKINFLEPIKEIDKFHEAVKAVQANETIKALNIQELIQAELKKALGK